MSEEPQTIGLFRRFLAETLGTFTLIFCGTGAIVINHASGGAVTHPGIALTFGLVVLSLIYTLGDVSGAHLNPAVTIGFVVAGRFPVREAIPYIIAQIIGAIGSSLLLLAMFPDHPTLGATLPVGAVWRSFVLEVFLTWFLMFAVMSVATGAKEKGLFAGVSIGSVIALEALFAGPICGASMNPARSLAPAAVSGNLDHIWVYLTAPTIGAVLGVFTWNFLQTSSPKIQNKQ